MAWEERGSLDLPKLDINPRHRKYEAHKDVELFPGYQILILTSHEC
jgi:hypothetical protein